MHEFKKGDEVYIYWLDEEKYRQLSSQYKLAIYGERPIGETGIITSIIDNMTDTAIVEIFVKAKNLDGWEKKVFPYFFNELYPTVELIAKESSDSADAIHRWLTNA